MTVSKFTTSLETIAGEKYLHEGMEIPTYIKNWTETTQYNVNYIIVDPTTNGIYRVVNNYTSTSSIETDIANGNLVLIGGVGGEGLEYLETYQKRSGGTGRVTPVEVISIISNTEIQIQAGYGYIINDDTSVIVEWTEQVYTNTATNPSTIYLYIDSTGTVNASDSFPNQNTNIILGFYYWAGQQIGMCQDYPHVIGNLNTRIMNYISRLGAFIYNNGGQVQETDPLKIRSASCKAQYGTLDLDLTEVSSDDAGVRFFIWQLGSSGNWYPDFWRLGMGGQVPTTCWNNTSKDIFPIINTTFTNMSTTVTVSSDVTAQLTNGNRIWNQNDHMQFGTPITNFEFTGGNTVITLATPYMGTSGTVTAMVNGSLESLAAGKYIKHLILRTFDNNFHLVFGQGVFDTEDDAMTAGIPSIPSAISDSNMKMATITVSPETTSLSGNEIHDARPLPFTDIVGGTQGGGAVSSHSALTDLGNDDHLQYFRTDGSRTGTGNFQTSGYFRSTVATGTQPIQVTSTTLNTNLNADQVDNHNIVAPSIQGNTTKGLVTWQDIQGQPINLNNLVAPGVYSVDNLSTNLPVAGLWYSVWVSYISHNNWVQQIAMPNLNELYIRYSYDDTGTRVWGQWTRIQTMEIRTSNPTSPRLGQMWFRSDL